MGISVYNDLSLRIRRKNGFKDSLGSQGFDKTSFLSHCDSCRDQPTDGKFIEKLGTYNPRLEHTNPQRIVMNIERIQYWISKGAQPTDRIRLFLSRAGVLPETVKSEQTKQHLPRTKAQERLKAAEKAQEKPADAAPAAPAQ
jgi:small subunit ribosomal protein S16